MYGEGKVNNVRHLNKNVKSIINIIHGYYLLFQYWKKAAIVRQLVEILAWLTKHQVEELSYLFHANL